MPPATAFVLAAAAVAAIVVIAGANQRRRKARAALLAEQGFRPLEPAPHGGAVPALREAPLLALYRRASSAAVLDAVQHREALAGHLFVFDVHDPTRPRQGVLATSAVGLVCPGLRLPPLAVAARVGPGLLQQLLRPLLERLAGPGEPVPFDDVPEFGARFTVLSLEPGGAAAVRAALTPAVRAALARAPLFLLLAAGEAAALQGSLADPELRGDELALLRRLLQAAQDVATALPAGGAT